MNDTGYVVYFENNELYDQKKSSLFLVLSSFTDNEKDFLCLSPIISDTECVNNDDAYYSLDLKIYNSKKNSMVDFANTIIVEYNPSICAIEYIDETIIYMILKKMLLYVSNLEKKENVDVSFIKKILCNELMTYSETNSPINIKM